MSNIIAGDPAPTNPTARGRIHELLWQAVPGADDAESKQRANALLDAYRAEVLAEAAKAVEAKRLSGASDVLVGQAAGISDAVAAINGLLEGGGSRG